MSKRVLLIGGNFFPELTGIGKYNGEMMDKLASMGYQCTVVTTFPYYPHWQIQPPYTRSSRWFKKELKPVATLNGKGAIQLFRCPHYVPQKPTGLKRMVSDFTFTFTAFIKILQLLFAKKYDFVLVVAPPFHLGLLGILYKKIRGAKLIYHIQDLQIDAARDFQLIKSQFIVNSLLKVEKFILKNVDVVSSISQGMIKKIESKFAGKVIFFPNWVDTEMFFPLDDKAQLKREFNFNPSDKVILYSGAIGEKQGLDAILKSAKTLKQESNLKFVICGSGPYKAQLQQLKEREQLDNVIFLPLQPFDKLNAFLNMADLHLVLQKANAADLVMPSKLTAILAVGGVAIITAGPGSSLFDVVSLHHMGILIEADNNEALTGSIEKALQNSNLEINNNARAYAQQYLSIDEIFRKFSLELQ
ncbi:MAG: WcaI family glycosyltransferase [Aquabacterium sp.]|nr:WcaI family glycosyltransferase [Ferruginibacter sp.]